MKNAPQICLYLGRLMKWRHSKSSHVSPSNTSFAYSKRHLLGYFLDAAPFAEIFVLPISNIESTISCVKVLVTPQDLVFYYGLSFSSWMIIFPIPGPSYSVWKYSTPNSGTHSSSFHTLFGGARFSRTLCGMEVSY